MKDFAGRTAFVTGGANGVGLGIVRNLLGEGCKVAILAQRASDLDWSRFEGIKSLGITAGASAPEVIVEEIMGAFAERYQLHVETVSAAEENEFFPLPRSLRPDAA